MLWKVNLPEHAWPRKFVQHNFLMHTVVRKFIKLVSQQVISPLLGQCTYNRLRQKWQNYKHLTHVLTLSNTSVNSGGNQVVPSFSLKLLVTMTTLISWPDNILVASNTSWWGVVISCLSQHTSSSTTEGVRGVTSHCCWYSAANNDGNSVTVISPLSSWEELPLVPAALMVSYMDLSLKFCSFSTCLKRVNGWKL